MVVMAHILSTRTETLWLFVSKTGRTLQRKELGELRKINREFDSMVKKVNENFSTLCINVQTAHSNGVERLLSTPAGSSLDSTATNLGQSVHNLKSSSVAAVSSSVSGVVEDLRTLKRNVERNVQALRSGGGGQGIMGNSQQPTSPLSPPSPSSAPSSAPSAPVQAASPMISFPSSRRDILARVVSSRGNGQIGSQSFQDPSSSSVPSPNFIPSSSSSSSSEEVSEEDPHPDLSSVNATSVFSIGYVGPPLLTPQETESFVYDDDGNKFRGLPSIGIDMAQKGEEGEEASGPAPVLRLEDVRKAVGKALVVYKSISQFGFRESSWENKMPWRNPRPQYLAKGLQWPRQRFSSVRDRYEYHRKARRRGRYLIGPTPGWSWFAADIVFLYFLINNPAGDFLI
ncbi:unnamed protein product [Calypogeia fissa]